jgi:hypothetical protein
MIPRSREPRRYGVSERRAKSKLSPHDANSPCKHELTDGARGSQDSRRRSEQTSLMPGCTGTGINLTGAVPGSRLRNFVDDATMRLISSPGRVVALVPRLL